MANRSYLYSIDFDVTQQKRTEQDKVLSISEWNYDIPISYKILLSVNTRKSHSLIWNYEHPIALTGDYEAGKNKLYEFLQRVYDLNLYDKEELQEIIKQTKEFLDREDRKQKYFFLECGEIYEMEDTPLEEQNDDLLEAILDVEADINEFINVVEELNNEIKVREEMLEEAKNASWIKKLFSKKVGIPSLEKDINYLKQQKIIELGIDNWTDVLYFDFEVE
ncbi:hypothetical protein D0T84_04150 [Dysgonomonas sp. 521]|uniref:DUF7822 domain-containing protein n=1 Tax=Dysgonomonas sp. 521 TaxID=2302932 RepID=UPI0013D27C1D|nr:hypothetical protein [Dysgonomonas sp. 521]NDV94111.1 hypothetical protein [Dysgonomonas sp. 521]